MKNNAEHKMRPDMNSPEHKSVHETLEHCLATTDFVEDVFPDKETCIQAFVDAVPTPMAIKGVDGKYKICNQGFADIVGLNRNQVIDKTVYDLFPENLARNSDIQDQKLLNSSEISFSEPSIISGEKSRERHFVMQKTALKDSSGKIRGIVGAGVEITIRKKMEEAVRQLAHGVSAHTGKKFFHCLAKLLAETLDAEHVVISRYNGVNRSMGQQLAIYPPENAKRSFVCELKDPACWSVISQGNYCLPDDVKPFCKACALAGITVDGYIGTALHDQEGAVVGAISVINKTKAVRNAFAADILKIFAARASSEIQRLAAEEEIVSTRDFHMNMLASLPAMVWRTNSEGKHDYFNKAWLEFTGLSLDEALSGRCQRVLHPADLQTFLETFEPALATQVSFQLETRILRFDGEYRSFFTTGRPFYAADGSFAGYIGNCVDITERKINEEQLRQVQRMESLGKLSAGIAHEFNNILAVIEGHAELLKMKRPTDEPLVKALNSILDASGRAAHLTNSMMAYTQKQLSSPEVVDLSDVVYEMDTFLSNVIRKDLNLKIELSREDLPVCIDIGQIEQVLMNLVSNGRDAMSSGGTLVVRTGATDQLPAGLDVTNKCPGGRHVVLTVSDDGCGMSSAIREKMYEPYFTTKDVGKGTGLGLSVAQGIIAQHNGHISCVSEEGRGTIFTIYFPLDESVGNPEAEESMIKEVVARNLPQLRDKRTVLLVDDDEMVRTVVEELLENDGYKVLSAACGDEALDLYEQHASRISLVIIDFNMPQKNGGQVARELRLKQCDLPVVIMSGDLNVPIDTDSDNGLIVDTLSKPFQSKTLLAKVKELIH